MNRTVSEWRSEPNLDMNVPSITLHFEDATAPGRRARSHVRGAKPLTQAGSSGALPQLFGEMALIVDSVSALPGMRTQSASSSWKLIVVEN